MYAGIANTSYFEIKVIKKIALENIVTRHQTIYPSGLTESLTICLFPTGAQYALFRLQNSPGY